VIKTFFYFLFIVSMFASSCKENLGPNEIGGSTDVPFAKVGEVTSVFVSLRDLSPQLENINVDFVVIENRGGIVVRKGHFETDTAFSHKIDTIVGTALLPRNVKKNVLEHVIKAFNITVDSSDKNNIKLDFLTKTKVTSEGIQDFFHSDGDERKPFTLIKYSANVGDKWEFFDSDGNKYVREVKYRSTDDDYSIGFLLIKVIKVEETIESGPLKDLFGKITYYTNHKFGLVGVEWEKKDGKTFRLRIFPSNY
ncbi:MAG: hypothetical protein ACUVQ1_09155, partial [Candidatus Kapaibacteriales bacterium]